MPSTSTPTQVELASQPTLFGHPTGLYTLFFAEMWERFSFYGMKALLLYYMIKGFLKYGDADAIAVMGAYGGLVYMMPFFGGMIADRVLGARRAVVLGGMLMALGHLVMTLPFELPFFIALALIICGNGFFKPNISTIVGTLYPEGSPRRDGGFTIFYMGINLGAALAPLVCGYIGEKTEWHYGFGLATVGMLIGLSVFVASIRISRILVMGGALVLGVGMMFLADNPYLRTANVFIGTALVLSGGIATMALSRGGLPRWAGAPADLARALKHAPKVYFGAAAAIPVLAWLLYANANYNLVDLLLGADFLRELENGGDLRTILATFLEEISTPTGLILMTTLVGSFAYLFWVALRSPRIVRHRMYVVLILTFFSLLFWAFFEQASTSVSNFADRNIDRVQESRVVEVSDVGKTIDVVLTQEQLGYTNGELLYTMDVLTEAREAQKELAEEAPEGTEVGLDVVVPWTVSEDDVGMGLAIADEEVPASVFLSVNPSLILIFGLVFTALWALLAKLRLEPSTPVKFALGLLQLGLGFVAYWYGAQTADDRGMVFVGWLLLGYTLHTTGELCLSPIGLSMVTKLSPRRLVSTVMGAWFLATAAAGFLAAIIAQFTGTESEGEGAQVIPIPSETVHVYGDVFQVIAWLAIGCGVFCLLLAPVLTKWMHVGEEAA